ncbi:UDP-glucose dehydrogenase [Helicobacter cetorum]|uniref:UDP-glucose 6-dehydrogenase n=1 Tax=Helicobacter cetorum (strain ATCC BAA-429 / MIT 00-7128) TaxID=182217 RepID=I0ENZ2_HELC0|nr:UDP-glucose dehydrogenase [Helicobacter cetorum]AFI04661.1 UDP-glucose dehydrogenase [Helicobacter cetorum MIT 00-7128]
MLEIIIVGFGVVGKNMTKFFTHKSLEELEKLKTLTQKAKTSLVLDTLSPKVKLKIYDPKLGFKLENSPNNSLKYAFICVPTDNDSKQECNLKNVKEVLSTLKADIYIIKSTIPPNTTDAFIKETNKKIIFSPEYFGSTLNNQNFNNHFVILGGKTHLTHKVANLYQFFVPSNFIIRTTTALNAEITKYMENSFIATKVTFMNEFYRIAKTLEADFFEIRELFLLDERMSRFFSFVFEESPFYDSHCLNKDIPALITHLEKNHNYKALVLQKIMQINEIYKQELKA